jgi:uncharacterized protein (TIRG00374 family)
MKICENNSIPISESISYTSSGFFFSAITPSAVGGQPMQLILMNRKKHKIEHSSLALLIEVMGAQSAAYIFAVVGLIYCTIKHIFLSKTFMSMFFLGLFFSLLFILFLFMSIFHSSFIQKILSRIFRKKPKRKAKIEEKILEYAKNASYMKTHVPSIIKIVLRSFLKMASYNAIPYFVCLSLGINAGSIGKIILLQSMLYLSVGFIPIPGAMGINEGLFTLLYTGIVGSYLGPITILVRLINFYIPVLVTGIISYISFSITSHIANP